MRELIDFSAKYREMLIRRQKQGKSTSHLPELKRRKLNYGKSTKGDNRNTDYDPCDDGDDCV